MAGKQSFDLKIKQLRHFRESIVSELARDLAKAANALVASEFAEGKNPDGVAWDPKKSGIGSPLVLSGVLRRGFRVEEFERGFRIVTNVAYAIFNQGRRQMLPSRRKVGRNWIKTFRVTAKATIARLTPGD